MGTIKDIVDLTTQLSQSVNDRKIATELLKIQTLTLQLQSEQESLHEKNIKLREERLSLKEEVASLKLELQEAKFSVGHVIDGTPTCPNCSTVNKPFYMSVVPTEFVKIMNASHECSQCKYNTKI